MSPAATGSSASGGTVTSSLPSGSTPPACPSSARPPGSSTRTRRPRVAHKRGVLRHAGRSVRYLRRPGSRTGTCVPGRPGSRRAARPGPGPWPGEAQRGRGQRAGAGRRELGGLGGHVDADADHHRVAGRLGQDAGELALTPPGPGSTSFGHLSWASTAATSRTAAATATPASSGSQPSRARGTAAGRSSTEKVRAARGGDTQVRPSRPRPAICCSAASTRPSGSPGRPRGPAGRSWSSR